MPSAPAVLITGARAPVALDLARRFAAQGWRVHLADSVACRISGWSRAASASHRIASARYAATAYIADLNALVARERIALLLPTCEEVFYLARYRQALPAQLDVLVDAFDTLRTLHSKWRFLQLARTLDADVDVPHSAQVRDLAQAREWAGTAPLVLKPEYSRFGVHVRVHPHGLPAAAPPLPDQGNWVAQRYCAGEERCSYAVARDGVLLAHAVYRPRYRLQRSSSYYFDAAPAPQIERFTAQLARALRFSGQLSFDWIVSAQGRYSVIECNPRATSGLHLFAASDPLVAALDGSRRDPAALVRPAPTRAAMLGPLMLGVALPAALRHGRLRQWREDYARADDVLAPRGDRRPLAGALRDLGSHARLALAQRCTLREASTRDTEWDGQALPPP
ncbi:ATP-grasp domain-containing protein [Xanthomonas campestris pv. phormiicola]|nr:ATP-grasp domain-containing protein [Xanthomonas campestris pv. phormiicola]UYC15924.1 ATP-grasp domain-containing protein [Xanthomonas campestris pv. phormiicola]